MSMPASILCPVDFSDASRGALRYAATIAGHMSARLIVLTVEDPLLTQALDLGTGIVWEPEISRHDLIDFVQKAFGAADTQPVAIDYEIAVGKPAEQILKVARERDCDLVVISTHGLTGMRKLFFGSTTERVLRETTHPVLITPAGDSGPVGVVEPKRLIGRILVPVDLSDASLYQVQIARRLGETLGVPLLLAHVIEPIHSRFAARLHLPSVESERRAAAEDKLDALIATLPSTLHPEGLVIRGDPAEEIAKVARDRNAGLVVIGLHGSPLLGPRMGSVTYRVLCLVPTLTLALPPARRIAPASADGK